MDPLPSTIFGKIRLCWLAIFDPVQFTRIESAFGTPEPRKWDRRIDQVRSGLAAAFVSTMMAALVGAGVGFSVLGILPAEMGVPALGGFGALLLLWGIVGLRGWDIQTVKGNTLSEQVNRWLYLSLSWVGTVLLFAAAVLGYW